MEIKNMSYWKSKNTPLEFNVAQGALGAIKNNIGEQEEGGDNKNLIEALQKQDEAKVEVDKLKNTETNPNINTRL